MPYILTLLLLLTSLYAEKSDFSIILDKPYNNELFDITQDYDRQISAVGFSNNYKLEKSLQGVAYSNPFDYLRSISNKHGSKINLIKIDNDANIQLDKTLNIPKFNKAVSILKTPNNGYFIGGYTDDGSLIVLKLNANGEIIFEKIFGTMNQDTMSKLIRLRDGGVLAIGSSTTSRFNKDNKFTNGLGGSDISVTRLSPDGTLLWSKKYGTQYDDNGIDAVEANDGSLLVLGSTNNATYKDINLMRITENGNKIWLKNFNIKNIAKAYKIIKLRDNNFLISLSEQNSINKNQIRLIKLELHSNIIIDKTITTTYASVLKDIAEYTNGDIVGVGYVQDTYNSDALVMNLNSELKLLCQEHFGGGNHDVFNAVSLLYNSQSATSGSNTSANSQESNMWIVKLNRDCTMAQKPLKSINIYEELVKLFKDEIETHKLSIKKDLSIEFSNYALQFKVSEYELSKTQKDFLNNFQKKLIPFLKKCKNEIDTLEINGHTSSEWGNANFTDRYLKNEKLSLNRSYATLSYIFRAQDIQTQKWLTKILKGSGSSYTKKIAYNEMENKEKSRRVSFKIILKTPTKNLPK